MILTWLKKNLFNSGFNTILTIVCVALLIWTIGNVGNWVFRSANWAAVTENARLLAVGRYPVQQLWRMWLALGLVLLQPLLLVLQAWLPEGKARSRLQQFSWVLLPLSLIVTLWLLSGGLGLKVVRTSLWGGLTLTLLVALISVGLAFPFAILLALGRQSRLTFPLSILFVLGQQIRLILTVPFSILFGWLRISRLVSPFSMLSGWVQQLRWPVIRWTCTIYIELVRRFSILLVWVRQIQLPVIRWICTIYIELVRGLPLIGILFMAQVMLQLMLPGSWRLDRLLRAIVGLVLFNAAYLAENVRGGLQSVPTGQIEAAKALGLAVPQTLSLVVLPQALRVALPAIVGQFISMFKDTSLLALFSLFELTGIARSILSQPDFLGRNAEVFLFIGLLYWVFCAGMSVVSRRLEVRS